MKNGNPPCLLCSGALDPLQVDVRIDLCSLVDAAVPS